MELIEDLKHKPYSAHLHNRVRYNLKNIRGYFQALISPISDSVTDSVIVRYEMKKIISLYSKCALKFSVQGIKYGYAVNLGETPLLALAMSHWSDSDIFFRGLESNSQSPASKPGWLSVSARIAMAQPFSQNIALARTVTFLISPALSRAGRQYLTAIAYRR